MAQPTYLPLWATDDTTLPATGETNKVRPREVLRTTGWDMGQIPTCEEWNWMFNNIYLWIEYLSGIYADATNLATPDTLAMRDSSGGIDFSYITTGGITVTDGITSEHLTVTDTANLSHIITTYGTIDGTTIGETSASPGTFSYLTANEDITFNGGITSSGYNTYSGSNVYSGTTTMAKVAVASGNIDGTTIGGTSAAPGTFSTLQANNAVTLIGGVTSTGTNSFSGTNTFSSQLNLQSSNISSNGYSYLPNGLMIQWGTVTVGTSDDTNVGASVTFPTTFPNAVFSTTANTTTRYFTSSDGYMAICACVGQSTSGFTVYVDSGNAEKLTQAQTVNWFAIGH